MVNYILTLIVILIHNDRVGRKVLKMRETNDFKTLRNLLGLTQAEAAAECTVSLPTWCGWEAKRHKPSKMAQPAIDKMKRRAEEAKKEEVK